MTRKSWDAYFMDIARQVASRATCPRKSVGAVFVRDKNILASGYNGALPGQPHCTDVGCLMEDGHCVRVNHAEANALCQAAKHGTRLEGATVYVTASPCWPCFRLIASAGITRIVFWEWYRDERIWEFAEASGIELVNAQALCTCGHEHDTWLEKGKPGRGGSVVEECGLLDCACKCLQREIP